MNGIKGNGARRLAVPALLLSLVLVFAAACGGAADSPPQPTATEEPSAAPRQPAEATPAPAAPAPTAASAAPVAVANTPEPSTTKPPPPTAAPAATPSDTSADTPEPAPGPAPATATPSPTATAAPPPPPCDGTRGGEIGNCAPEFAGTQEWINGGPLTMEQLRGKVVLIDFWTYTCINCIRTLPYLKEWHDRYAGEGLVIVGVHTPEFEFEKLYDNVAQATKDEGVAWTVVQDNEYSVWRSYSNRFWPAKYLIDQDGVIQYRHFGEGRYAETEEEIRKLLAEAGAVAQDMPLPEDQQTDTTFLGEGNRHRTPELFAGWHFVVTHYQGGRGLYIGQVEAYNTRRNEVAQMEIPSELKPDRIYFNGPWYLGAESARHAGKTGGYEDYLALVYSARSVNAVLTSESGEPYKVRVTVNGEYLTDDNKGKDVIIGEDGVSYLMVTAPKLYKIVEHPTWEGGQELRMASMSDDFGLYSFTFGTYEDGY